MRYRETHFYPTTPPVRRWTPELLTYARYLLGVAYDIDNMTDAEYDALTAEFEAARRADFAEFQFDPQRDI